MDETEQIKNSNSTAKTIDITPKKKILRSISTDLTLPMILFEIIDNSIDAWNNADKGNKLIIKIQVKDKNLIYEDNAEGIKEENITSLFTLGESGNNGVENTIGEFGVGLKRALFSMAKQFTFNSKYLSEGGFKCHVDVESYYDDPEWKLSYTTPTEITEGSTLIEFYSLNFTLSEKIERELRKNIAETYAYSLKSNGEIFINDTPVTFRKFEEWAKFEDEFVEYDAKGLRYSVEVHGKSIQVIVKIGLMNVSHQTGDYGFYIYCNDRLAIKDAKTPELGFDDSDFGYPHARLARFRCEIYLNGPSSEMPWDSTKSGIKYDHILMEAILPNIKNLAKEYLLFSGKLASPSQTHVRPNINTINDIPIIRASPGEILKILPEGKPHKDDKKQKQKKKRTNEESWKVALKDAVKICDVLSKRKGIGHRNRVIILILDSTMEVGMKNYLFYVLKNKINSNDLKNMSFDELSKSVKDQSKNSGIKDEDWNNIKHLHSNRNKLYHEVADLTVEDKTIVSQRSSVVDILSKLLNIDF